MSWKWLGGTAAGLVVAVALAFASNIDKRADTLERDASDQRGKIAVIEERVKLIDKKVDETKDDVKEINRKVDELIRLQRR